MGLAHRLVAARGGVDDREAAEQHARPAHVPAEHHRQDERRGVDREPGRETALEQEQPGRERAGLAVEAALEVFVRRVELEPVVDRDRGRAQHHHREREAEVELDEAEPIRESLARSREEGDRARLGRHHRERDVGPRQAAPGDQVGIEVVAAAPAPEAVGDEQRERAEQDRPVDAAHAQPRVSRPSRAIASASTPMTSA